MNTINNEVNVLECFFQFSSTVNKYFLEKMTIPKIINSKTHLATTICYESCSPTLCIIFLFSIHIFHLVFLCLLFFIYLHFYNFLWWTNFVMIFWQTILLKNQVMFCLDWLHQQYLMDCSILKLSNHPLQYHHTIYIYLHCWCWYVVV